MALTTKRGSVHLPQAPVAPQAGIEYRTDPGPRALVDAEIENETFRRDNLDADHSEGILCIAVAPGDVLGEVRVNVQFEGAVGRWDECVARQGAVLADSLDWLRDFFESLGQFEASIAATPCPKAAPEVRVVAIDAVVQRELVRDRAIEVPVDVGVDVDREREVQRQLGTEDDGD